MDFKINKDDVGRTVLSFVRSRLKISASALASLKRVDNGITVNEKHVTVRYVLREGDILSINDKDSFEDENRSIEPHSLPIDILLENDGLFIINKSPNMPTHPSHNHTDDTLANALAYIYKERGEPFVFRPIGRLDKNTSGISLIAKNSISASFLYHARVKGMINKRYIAILEGNIASDNDWHLTELYMKRMSDSVIIRCVGEQDDPETFIAITRWRALYSNDRVSLVEAEPITGRTHQIRVNFASLGHPLLGDDLYGKPSELINRHSLHAYMLSIPMPYGDKITTFCTMPPTDMQAAFSSLTGIDMCKIINSIKDQI